MDGVTISVFQLRLFCGQQRIKLNCHRSAAGFILEGDGFRMSIAISEARALARAGEKLRTLGILAGDGPMKPGYVFRRELPSVGLLEIGVAPDGVALYVTLGSTHIVFADEQVLALHAALARLRDAIGLVTDGNSLGVASAGPQRQQSLAETYRPLWPSYRGYDEW